MRILLIRGRTKNNVEEPTKKINEIIFQTISKFGTRSNITSDGKHKNDNKFVHPPHKTKQWIWFSLKALQRPVA